MRIILNQFLGINPLLHSQLQTEGGWDNFHVNHISDLTRFLQRDLRPLGYLAQTEQSLQIRRRDESVRQPESDVTLYDPQQRPPPVTTLGGGLAYSVPDLLALVEEEIATYRAIGIYQKDTQDNRGEAVAWIELLSPANKPGGRHFAPYHDKRTALLQAGLVFVELDYLHHQPATVAVPAGSSPYRILVIDPRPNWLQGEGRIFPIYIDEKIPTLAIPLNAGDVFQFDFDAPYQQTYEALFFGDEINYNNLPPSWERYEADDQAQILSRLLHIRNNPPEEGTPPQPIERLSLETARQQW